MIAQSQQFLSVHCIPLAYRTVLTGGGHALAVRTVRYSIDRANVSAQGQQHMPVSRIPNLRGLVRTRGGDACSIRTISYAIDRGGMRQPEVFG